MRRQHVGLAIAVDVRDADAMPILLAAAEVMDDGLVFAEINPQHAGPVVVRQRNIGFAVAVDVGERSALGVEAVGNLLRLPHFTGGDGLRPGVPYHHSPFESIPSSPGREDHRGRHRRSTRHNRSQTRYECPLSGTGGCFHSPPSAPGF